MGKVTRADLLRELVEDTEGYDGHEERRDEKKQRKLKTFRESHSSNGKDKEQRRAWKLQRSIRRGDYDFGVSGNNDTQQSHRNEGYDE